MHPEILFTSPVSGTVGEIVRGAKRKLLAVLVKADEKQEYVDFGAKNAAYLAAQIMALSDPVLDTKVRENRKHAASEVIKKDAALQEKLKTL